MSLRVAQAVNPAVHRQPLARLPRIRTLRRLLPQLPESMRDLVKRFCLLVTAGTLNLLRQDKLLGRRQTWRLFREHLFSRHHMARRSLAHLRDYLRPGFHSWQLRDYPLAQAVLTRYGSEQAALLEPFERPGSDAIS